MINGKLVTVEGRPALRFERRLDHSVERVWRAVTEPAELERWFVARVEWTPRRRDAREHGAEREITEHEPPYVLAWQHGTGWELHLDRLAAHLDGRAVLSYDELFGAFPELHERYAAELGLDPEVGRRAFAAMQEEAG